MQRTPVVSSNLASVGYDAEDRLLEVEFKNGTVYQYLNVGPDTWAAMQAANSQGQYLNQHIKPGHMFRKLEHAA